LFAESEDGARQYIMRTAEPRFIAELLDDPGDLAVTITGEVWWLDEPPADAAAVARLMRLAGEAVARYDAALDALEDDDDD